MYTLTRGCFRLNLYAIKELLTVIVKQYLRACPRTYYICICVHVLNYVLNLHDDSCIHAYPAGTFWRYSLLAKRRTRGGRRIEEGEERENSFRFVTRLRRPICVRTGMKRPPPLLLLVASRCVVEYRRALPQELPPIHASMRRMSVLAFLPRDCYSDVISRIFLSSLAR